MNPTRKLIYNVARFLDKLEEDNIPPRSNNTIWNEYLHVWDNQTWENVLNELNIMIDEYTIPSRDHFKHIIATSIIAMMKSEHLNNRCMDLPQNKKQAWSTFLTIKEIVDEISAVPVRTKTITTTTTVTTEVFEDRTVITIQHPVISNK